MAALIARNQTTEMTSSFNQALDNGVKPGEISEIITHLAFFYSGWANALSAVVAAKTVFVERGIGADQLPAARPQELLPMNQAAEEQREATVQANLRGGFPGAGALHEGIAVSCHLWLRPGLARRETAVWSAGQLR